MSRPRNILVLDRDDEFRGLIVGLLEELGERVIAAKRPQEALRLCEQYEPEILFTDVMLPAAGDRAALRRISCTGERQVLTAILSGDAGPVEESLRRGVCEIIDEVPSPAELNQILTRFSLLHAGGENRSYRVEALSRARLDLELESKVEAIAPTVKLIVNLLPAFDSPETRVRLEIALDEAMRNALEHGNFGISGEEKNRLLHEEAFEAELKRQEALPENKHKRIHVSAEYAAGEFRCTIRDDGQGFKWKALPEQSRAPVSLANLNGRGVLLMRQMFDVVEYNEKGNQVRLVKKWPAAPSS